MILFLDTSALVKLFQPEHGTQEMIQWVQAAQQVNLLELARLEFASVLQRRYRDRELNLDDLALLNSDKVRIHRLFKKPAGKAQKKFKAEAYFVIREGLNFLQQRSQQ